VELHGKDAMPNRLKDEAHYEETARILSSKGKSLARRHRLGP